MQKKGFVRTLEAVIAVIVLLSVVLILAPKIENNPGTPNNVEQAYIAIFSEVLYNDNFRNCIANEITSEGALNNAEGDYEGALINSTCASGIKSLIEKHKPKNYVYLAEICEKSESCLDADLPVDKSIYVESVMLAAKYPKIFRIYFWEK